MVFEVFDQNNAAVVAACQGAQSGDGVRIIDICSINGTAGDAGASNGISETALALGNALNRNIVSEIAVWAVGGKHAFHIV